MTKHRDRREWALGGHEITQLLIDSRFGIVVWWKEGKIESSATFFIEAPFTILKDASEQKCDPGETASLGPALSLLGRGIDSVAAYRDGLMQIRFSDGTELRVLKRPDDLETWESFGSGELHDLGMLCSPHDVAPWSGKL